MDKKSKRHNGIKGVNPEKLKQINYYYRCLSIFRFPDRHSKPELVMCLYRACRDHSVVFGYQKEDNIAFDGFLGGSFIDYQDVTRIIAVSLLTFKGFLQGLNKENLVALVNSKTNTLENQVKDLIRYYRDRNKAQKDNEEPKTEMKPKKQKTKYFIPCLGVDCDSDCSVCSIPFDSDDDEVDEELLNSNHFLDSKLV